MITLDLSYATRPTALKEAHVRRQYTNLELATISLVVWILGIVVAGYIIGAPQ